VVEDYRLSVLGTPVLVENVGSVLRRNMGHGDWSLRQGCRPAGPALVIIDLGQRRARTRPSKQLARGGSAPDVAAGQLNRPKLSASRNLPMLVSVALRLVSAFHPIRHYQPSPDA